MKAWALAFLIVAVASFGAAFGANQPILALVGCLSLIAATLYDAIDHLK